MRTAHLLVALVALVACGGKKPAPRVDEAAAAPDAAAVTPSATTLAPAPAHMATTGRPRLQISLRSTPAGASAAIDGRTVGTTPVRWEMEDDGRLHDFAFTLHGFETWRLRFSPSHDGVVHAPLRALPGDAGPNDQGSTQ